MNTTLMLLLAASLPILMGDIVKGEGWGHEDWEEIGINEQGR